MKHEEDELAEAALLLAHVAEAAGSERMPAALQEKILARGMEIAQSSRFTTTKAGAVSIEAPPVLALLPRRSNARTWAGWLAAAACFALAVYGWRSSTLEREARERAAASAGPPATAVTALALKGPGGATLAHVTLDSGSGGQLTLAELEGGDVHYELWLSSSDRAHAAPAGAFACGAECRGKSFRFSAATSSGGVVRAAWLTRRAGNAVGAAATAPLSSVPEGDIVATGWSEPR